MNVTGRTLNVMSDRFRLSDLLQESLVEFSDGIEDIVETATKEQPLEQVLLDVSEDAAASVVPRLQWRVSRWLRRPTANGPAMSRPSRTTCTSCSPGSASRSEGTKFMQSGFLKPHKRRPRP